MTIRFERQLWVPMAVLLLMVSAPAAWAQADTVFLTGDSTLDNALQDAEDLSLADPAGFLQSVATQYKVPLKDLQALRDQGLKPGEILLAVNLSQATKKTLTQVSASWKANKGKGWGAIAKDLGVKPGSDAFQTLKKTTLAEKDRLKAEEDKKPVGAMMKAAEPNKAPGDMKAKKPDAAKKP